MRLSTILVVPLVVCIVLVALCCFAAAPACCGPNGCGAKAAPPVGTYEVTATAGVTKEVTKSKTVTKTEKAEGGKTRGCAIFKTPLKAVKAVGKAAKHCHPFGHRGRKGGGDC